MAPRRGQSGGNTIVSASKSAQHSWWSFAFASVGSYESLQKFMSVWDGRSRSRVSEAIILKHAGKMPVASVLRESHDLRTCCQVNHLLSPIARTFAGPAMV